MLTSNINPRTAIYQTLADGYYPRRVAEEFAARYFDKPRAVRGTLDAEGKFKLVGGNSTYQIERVNGDNVMTTSIYKVWRLT